MILEYLGTGQSQARTHQSLAILTGWTVRDVQEAIEVARQGGSPICSGNEGVWVARDATELETFLAAYDRRLRTMVKTRGGLRRAFRGMREREAKVVAPSIWEAA